MVTTTLVEDLSARLPDASIFAEEGAISGRPDLRLELDIHRFEPGPDGRVHLVAQLALDWEDGSTRSQAQRLALSKPSGRSTHDSIASADVTTETLRFPVVMQWNLS